MASFGGAAIFGLSIKQAGPFYHYRQQKEQLPGVSGARLYRLGGDTQFWTLRGRLTALTLTQLLGTIDGVQGGYMNGNVYPFVDNGGTAHANCTLNDYRQAGEIEATNSGFTCEIVATIEQMSP